MTARKSKAKGETPKHGEDERALKARVAKRMNAPSFRHGLAICQIQDAMTKGFPADQRPDMSHYADDIADRSKVIDGDDLTLASRLLTAQAMTLDAIFVETARRMALNMGEHMGAMEVYARIALKAQANSRATIEALAKLHQPREQTVRHVHVNEGGQAVIADEFHHHQHGAQGGAKNGQSSTQPHATGTGPAGTVAALPSPNPIGQGVPLACGEGKPAVQDARRQG